jgi:4-amino-4-deoxy-L-arabinose transferase-like glycosyltransferase
VKPALFERREAAWALVGLFVLAAIARVAYVHWIAPPIPPISDASGYFHMGAGIADGDGFVSWTARRFQRKIVYSAAYPPLYPGLLALLRLLVIEALGSQRLVVAMLGAINIPLIGLIGRAIGGWRCGLVAAAIATVSPFLLEVDGSFMTESRYLMLCLSGTLALLSTDEERRVRRFGLAGICFGLAALTRSEGVILFALLALPLALFVPSQRRIACAGFAIFGFALVVAPWTVRNALQLDSFIPVSQSLKGVLLGANCEQTYYGDHIGSWSFRCVVRVNTKGLTEVEAFARYQELGLGYMAEHRDVLPRVVGARVLRTFGLFRPGVWFGLGEVEIRNADFSRRTIGVDWLLLSLALPGLVIVARRSRLHAWLLSAPILTVTLTSAIAYGNPRFRVAAEPALILAASMLIVALWDRGRSRAPIDPSEA